MAIISFTNYKRRQTAGCMGAVMRYTMQDKKTEFDGQRLVTGINCQPESVYADFMTTKRLYHKTDDSNSIQNQKLLLEKYATEKGFINTIFLSDDGYSGTNFNRPGWQQVMEMIENGEVETLIVKDMSRLGREYLQVGQYTELIFPSYGTSSTSAFPERDPCRSQSSSKKIRSPHPAITTTRRTEWS